VSALERYGEWADKIIGALAQSSDLLIVADAALVIRFASQGARDLLGYEPSEVVGRDGLEFLHPDDVGLFATVAAMATEGYVPRSAISYRLRHSDGSYVVLDLAGGPLLTDGEPGPARAFWLVGRRPIRAQIYAEVLHRLLAEEPLAAALEGVSDAMIPKVGTMSGITLWSPGRSPVSVGHDLPDLLTGVDQRPGSPWDEALHTGVPQVSTDLSTLDPEIADAARREGLSRLTVIPVAGLDGAAVATITHWTRPGHPHPDASAEVLERTTDLVAAAVRLRQQIEQLRQKAASDPLTGLANRRAVEEAMERFSATVESSVLYLDLDGFKEVNDTYGHPAGDEVLKVVAKRLQSVVRADDLVARIGGDEFAVLCRNCGSSEAERLSLRIREVLDSPIVLPGLTLHVSASVGASTSFGVDQRAFLQADQALYRAKQARRNTA
jgi:diguanylate cyclase (GGDEF)-like protein/PAS domain S-box-containing protein